MNRISTIRPLAMRYGPDLGKEYVNEFKRRRDRIADKPVSLGVHFSALETPSEPAETAKFEPPTPRYSSLQYERERDWRLTKAILFVCAVVIVCAVGYLVERGLR